jgi:hypothetical protein
MRQTLIALLIATVCLTLLPLSAARGASLAAPRPDPARREAIKNQALVIEHVTVLPMTASGAVVSDATVVIVNERIASLQGPVPEGAVRIDGLGKWLIPGLTDMHVHVPLAGLPRPRKYPTEPPAIFFDTQDIMTPYVANGVTQIFNLDARPESIGQRHEIQRGDVLGPHMALAAVINSGSKNGFSADSPADGRQAVRDAKAEGYEFIKTYSMLGVETFAAVVDEAARQGLKVVGHIPVTFKGKTELAFVPNFGLVAHAEEFAKQSENLTDEDVARFVELAKKNGTWLCPTLTTMRWIASQSRSLDELVASPTLQYMHPLLQSKWLVANQYRRRGSAENIAYFEQVIGFNNRLVRAFKAAGIPMVAGTDTLTSGVVPGFSLHDELALMVDAGLTPEEALDSATRLPCVWLGVESDRGTVEVGKRADLVLLDADPRENIAHTRRIAGVLISGRWSDRAALDAMLADLAERNTATKDQFDWLEFLKK